MAKFSTYLLVMSGLTLLFYFGGLLQDSPNSILLNLLLSPQSLQESDLSLKILLAVEGILAIGVVASFAFAGKLELGLMTIPAVFLFNLLWDFLSVYSVVAATNIVAATLLISPLLVLFAVTMLEWWRGVTT